MEPKTSLGDRSVGIIQVSRWPPPLFSEAEFEGHGRPRPFFAESLLIFLPLLFSLWTCARPSQRFWPLRASIPIMSPRRSPLLLLPTLSPSPPGPYLRALWAIFLRCDASFPWSLLARLSPSAFPKGGRQRPRSFSLRLRERMLLRSPVLSRHRSSTRPTLPPPRLWLFSWFFLRLFPPPQLPAWQTIKCKFFLEFPPL